jgi:hypothetical protein
VSTVDIERLHFYQRQALGAVDLEAQQAYHRDMRRRHNLGPHTWGIVAGLELEEVPPPQGVTAPPELWIRPGFAVDGFGRELVVLEPYRLDPAQFKNEPNDYIAVYLAYDEEAAASPASGYELCDTPDQFGRVRESFRVVVGTPLTILSLHENVTVAGKVVTPREAPPPAQATGPNLELETPPDESVAYQQFPDDELDREARWLVRLGSVNWDGKQFETNDGTRLQEERQYAGLVAERIFAPTDHLLIRRRWADDVLIQAIVENSHLNGNGGAQVTAREDEMRACTLGFFGSTQAVFRDLLPKTGFVAALKDSEQLAFNHQGEGPITFHTADWNERMRVTTDGYVGIGTKAPSTRLEVNRDWDGEEGAVRVSGDKPTIRFAGGANAANESWLLHLGSNGPGNIEFFHRTGAKAWESVLGMQRGYAGIYARALYLSGGGIPQESRYWNSISFNAHHSAENNSWIFPDPSTTAVTIEMDDGISAGRFEIWGTTKTAKTSWSRRFAINTESGDTYLGESGGNVGIGTTAPDKRLHVKGDAHITGDLDVGGNILHMGNGALTVLTQQFAIKNGQGVANSDGQNQPGVWTYDHTGLISQRLGFYVVLNGFTIFDGFDGSPDWENKGFRHAATLNAIPQLVYVRITDSSNANRLSGLAYTSESKQTNEGDNATLFTVVVIGRT